MPLDNRFSCGLAWKKEINKSHVAIQGPCNLMHFDALVVPAIFEAFYNQSMLFKTMRWGMEGAGAGAAQVAWIYAYRHI